MEKKNVSLNSLFYDEDGAKHIHHQINDAYSSGVVDEEYSEDSYLSQINESSPE